MGSEKQLPQAFADLLFLKLFQTFRMAIQPNKLIIAFSALTIICLAGWIMDFSRTVVVAHSTQGEITELQIYMTNPDQLKTHIETNRGKNNRTGLFSTLWHFAAKKFHSALNSLFAFDTPAVAVNIADYFRALGWAVRYHFIYCAIFFVLELAVISIAGGSLCRISALQLARGEKPGLTEALHFSRKKFLSLFATPLVPVGIIIFMGLFIYILGLIGNIPWVGELIMGVSIPLALIGGTLIAIVAIGTVVGFNLMFPAIAYDGSDCFDAISRSFSYVYAKPWRMGFYTVIAAVYGAICYTFIRFFAFLLLLVTHLFLQLGVWIKNSDGVNKLQAIWPKPSFTSLLGLSGSSAANWSESIAAFLVYLTLLVVVGLVVSFVISFYFSANTVIYSLMRNKVHNTSLEDIYTDFDEFQTQPAITDSGLDQSKPQPETEAQPNQSS